MSHTALIVVDNYFIDSISIDSARGLFASLIESENVALLLVMSVNPDSLLLPCIKHASVCGARVMFALIWPFSDTGWKRSTWPKRPSCLFTDIFNLSSESHADS